MSTLQQKLLGFLGITAGQVRQREQHLREAQVAFAQTKAQAIADRAAVIAQMREEMLEIEAIGA
jgi:hypothetical protein